MANRDLLLPRTMESYRCLACDTKVLSRGKPKSCIRCRAGAAWIKKIEESSRD